MARRPISGSSRPPAATGARAAWPTGSPSTHLLVGFHDPRLGRDRWRRLVYRSGAPSVFQSYEWQRAWWGARGRGRLALVAAEHKGEPIALAPLATADGVVGFVGSGELPRRDVLGDVGDPAVLAAMLERAIDGHDDFQSVQLSPVSENSRTCEVIARSAEHLGLRLSAERVDPTGFINLERLSRRRRLGRIETRANGGVATGVEHVSGAHLCLRELAFCAPRAAGVVPASGSPSGWEELERPLHHGLIRSVGDAGWFIFTRLDRGDEPIGWQIGVLDGRRYVWYRASVHAGPEQEAIVDELLDGVVRHAARVGAEVLQFPAGLSALADSLATRTEASFRFLLQPAG